MEIKEVYNQSNKKSYEVYKDNLVVAAFSTTSNPFHLENQYVYFDIKSENLIYASEIFNKISSYFKKPLQVMIDSTEKNKIKVLNEAGFKLKRRCYERTFNNNQLIETRFKNIELHIINKNQKDYELISNYAYNNYLKTHKNVSPLTASLSEFMSILPKTIIYQKINNNILNYVYIEDNELCYIASYDKKSFKDFAYSVFDYVFKKYSDITFESDDTDHVAMKFKGFFIDNDQSSFNTYVFNLNK